MKVSDVRSCSCSRTLDSNANLGRGQFHIHDSEYRNGLLAGCSLLVVVALAVVASLVAAVLAVVVVVAASPFVGLQHQGTLVVDAPAEVVEVVVVIVLVCE